MKLLIVDDSSIIRRSVISVYQNSVFTQIETAADGLLALTAFKKLLPDVVTLDITMPHMDGLAAMTKMLEIKPNTIILIISALADHHTAIESLSRGAHQFICKPFTDQDLKEALDSLILENGRTKALKPEDSVIVPEQILENSHLSPQPSPETYPSGYVSPPLAEVARSSEEKNQKKPRLILEKPPLPLRMMVHKKSEK